MRARSITLVALLAAIYAVVGLLPGFPVIGLPGSDIRLTRTLEMGYGVALGPVLGPLAAFVGAVVSRAITGGGTAILFTPLALVSSFTAAAMSKKNLFGVRGWMASSVVMAGMLLAWYATPVGQAIPIYALPHFLGLGIVLVMREKIAELLESEKRTRLFLGFLLSSYPSTMAGQMLGNLIFMALVNPTPGFFMAVLPVTLVERSVITFLAALVGVPLLLAIRTYLSKVQ